MSSANAFADDILCGADEIALFLFGSRKARRKVYYLKESGRLPTFDMGGICARRSTLLAWVTEQESLTSPNSDWPHKEVE